MASVLSEKLIVGFNTHDVIIITAPMYNFSISIIVKNTTLILSCAQVKPLAIMRQGY
nr:NAD(P)H-dependent oxidoreductase [Proteus hauseri]